MSAKNLELLQQFLEQGDCFIGEVRVSGQYILCHRDDMPRETDDVFYDPHDAIAIARHDDAGGFRPLKTAPNLRHGWRIELSTIEDVLLALDFLYPAAIGTIQHFTASTLEIVPLRHTLERQSGMYAVVKKISDEQADKLIGETCNAEKGCLRKILWPTDEKRSSCLSVDPATIRLNSPEIPLLCAEACNLLVAAGRKVVKARDKHAGL